MASQRCRVAPKNSCRKKRPDCPRKIWLTREEANDVMDLLLFKRQKPSLKLVKEIPSAIKPLRYQTMPY